MAFQKKKQTAKHTAYTPEQQQEMLKNFQPIPRDLLDFINENSYLRYYTTARRDSSDDGFRVGGYVEANPVVVDGGKKIMKLRSLFHDGPGCYRWSVAHGDLDEVYAKENALTVALLRQFEAPIKTLNENNKKLLDANSKLKKRIEKLEALVGRPK